MTIIKRMFCKHDYKWMRKVELYSRLNGETHYLVCTKCGKVKATREIEYP